MNQVLQTLIIILTVYLFCLFAWAILSWLDQLSPSTASHPFVRSAQRFLDSIVLPYVKLFSFIKPVRLGGAYLDMSSLVAFLALIVVLNILQRL